MSSPSLAQQVALRIVAAQWEDFPERVRRHALRSFVNVVGCAAGGVRHEAVQIAERALSSGGATGNAAVIGSHRRAPPAFAALLNGLSSSVHAFDDTHAETMVHPASPVWAALVAATGAKAHATSGPDFMLAFAIGLEVVCRLSVAVAPARGVLGWSESGLAGAIGAAAATAKLLQADADGVASAIGIAASLAGGLRVAHGTMAMHMIPAHAASLGVQAALLGVAGLTAPLNAFEGPNGFLSLYAPSGNGAVLAAEWGTTYKLLSNTFKAYPCGIVLHPVIDACLRLRAEMGLRAEEIAKVDLAVSEAAAQIANRPEPPYEFESQVSLQHWAAKALLGGLPAVTSLQEREVASIAALRPSCFVRSSPGIAMDAAEARVTLRDGRSQRCRIEHCRGSLQAPLGDEDLSRKFLLQAEPSLGAKRSAALLRTAWSLESLGDVRPVWDL